MPPLLDKELLSSWEKRLGLSPTNTYRAKRSQISSSYKRMGHLIGYCAGDNTIYYSCKVSEDVIVHELLHKLHPDLSEKEIRRLTKETVELFKFWEGVAG